MSNFQTTVTITDIYGAEWWERNREELEREWEWSFGKFEGRSEFAEVGAYSIRPFSKVYPLGPRVILHRRKPKPPTLREVYGVDEVTIPVGWEWTGEWRVPVAGDQYAGSSMVSASVFAAATYTGLSHYTTPRLILRERPKKVWFKCEAEPRVPRNGDWFYSYGAWCESDKGGDGVYLCATRHEEPDLTVQTVAQADIDAITKANN